MRIESYYGYSLEIYDKGNYGTVKRKKFIDMIELVTFTFKSELKNHTSIIDITGSIIDIKGKSYDKPVYKGCITLFNRKANEILEQGNYTILED